jgi:drug/metabolite transporter (DMT)-like permease
MLRSHRSEITREQLKLSFIPGLLLGLTLLLQTWGLKYTTATKCGFITTMYAVFVPILERVWLKRRLPRLQPLYVGIALIGMALITDLHASQAEWNIGDTLTLLCAVTAALHMVWFAFIHDKIQSSFTFNNFQSMWAALMALPLALVIDPFPNLDWANRSWIGFISLSLFSTMIAFALQVRAQKVLSPSIASLLFLLESPFAGLFAMYFLNETLGTWQWAGAALILAAAAFSSWDSARNAPAT